MMTPISRKITEMQHVETTRTLTETYGLQHGRSKLLYSSNSPLPKRKHSLFYPNIGNGMPLKYLNVFLIFGIHFWALYSVFVVKYSVLTGLWSIFMCLAAGFGVTGGVHRYWTHKTYKANLPLRIILMLCYSVAGQKPIFDWVRDHRVHHKFSDTDADPHNASNGFFFSHVGWMIQKKHPEVIRAGKQLDMSDVLSDPVVQFSQKHFITMKIMFCFLLPTMAPVYLFGEDWYNAFMAQCLIRYCMTLNFTWAVNSAAHIWGTKPYDPNIRPTQNKFVSFIALGEGWHNYHHVFPWDYKAAEIGGWLNMTTTILNYFHYIGWAWDMKEPNKDLIQRVMARNAEKQIQHLPEVPPPAE